LMVDSPAVEGGAPMTPKDNNNTNIATIGNLHRLRMGFPFRAVASS
jgi:hypothetical protein